MTPVEASRKAGLHPSYLTRTLRRDSPGVNPATREALERVLGVDVTTPQDPRQAAPPPQTPAVREKPEPPQRVAASQVERSRTRVIVKPGPFIHPGPRVAVFKVTRRKRPTNRNGSS